MTLSLRHGAVSRWTLALDESGAFEGDLVVGRGDEHVGWVIGGVLLPGEANETSRALDSFRAWCRGSVGFPPHATDLDLDARKSLAEAASGAVLRLGGMWIFVVSEARKTGKESALGRFVRMYGASIDAVGRLVASLGGAQIDARPAQRSVPLRPPAMNESAMRGMTAVVNESDEGGPRSRAMLQAETRHALEALARESWGALAPWPKLASVVVETAAFGGAHPGLSLADIGCNRVYSGLRREAGASLAVALAPFAGAPLLVLHIDALRILREIDRALRDQPADLVLAARHWARLAGDARAPDGPHLPDRTVRESALTMAEALWDSAVRLLATQGDLGPMAIALAARAEAELTRRAGAYEGVWRALDAGFVGDGALARATRAACSDSVLAARLFRLAIECANHRGDVARAEAAVTGFHRVAAGGKSYRLLAEDLVVRNVAVVALQNQLPADPAKLDAVVAELEERTRALVTTLEHAGQVVALSELSALPGEDASLPVHRQPSDTGEEKLWRALGGRPSFGLSDRERGMGYGTVAKSHALMGRFDEARLAARDARALFADSPFNLRFNAAVLARIEIERARKRPGEADGELLDAALALSGATALLKLGRAREMTSDPGRRFAFDILLRALLWAAPAWTPARESLDALVELLSSGELYESLARGELRSHPTELLGRHAGELIRRHRGPGPASARWFALSAALSDEASEGSTIARLGPFTKRLALDPAFESEGEPGSWLNPSFEYR